MSLFGSKGNQDAADDEEINRRFEALASSTPELGGFGPRDWTPAEDTEGFEEPDPPLPRLSKRSMWGWILLVAALLGLVILGLTRPWYSPFLAVLCLAVLGISFALLMLRP